ncbi:hypothetical protein APHAL10511_000922 [Amanita phalloides]|nr:hypothetical protein APHAL10511_000922 [Amanita phalloides]
MASAYIIDGVPLSEPPIHFDLGDFPHDAGQTTGMTSIIVEPKDDIIPEWPTHDPSTSETACITMLIRRNSSTKTKGILISPSKRDSLSPSKRDSLSPSSLSKRDSLSPSLLSSSRTSSSSCMPADATTTATTPESISSTESLKHNSMIDPIKRASTQASESCEEGDEKTFKEQRLNVKFAPLPDLGPRRRRGIPLGIAARSRLVRRRRPLVPDGGSQQYVVSTPMWTDEEMEEQRQRLARAWEKEREGREYYSEVDENGGDLYEDPFVTLGKIVKDAGKQLWQRMSNREGKDNSKSVKGGEKKGKGKEDDKAEADDTELDSPGPSQQLDASSSQPAPSEIDSTSPPAEKERVAPSGQERVDDGTFSWDEVGGKELPSPSEDTVTRKRNLWSRMRTQSKPKETPPTPTPTKRRSFVRSLRGRSMERSDDDVGGAAKLKDKDKFQPSVSSGLRRSLSF